MGPVIVDIMPGGSLAAEPKKLHPFFTAPRTSQSDLKQPDVPTGRSEKAEPQISSIGTAQPDGESSIIKRRRAAEDVEESQEDNKKPGQGRNKARQHGSSITSHFLRANTEVDRLDVSQTSEIGSREVVLTGTAELQPATALAESPSATIEDKGVGETMKCIEAPEPSRRDDPPKRILQLNRRTGTIGSPPKSKESKPSKQDTSAGDSTDVHKQTPKPRGRKPNSKTIKISYGNDDASRMSIGTKIDQILDSLYPPNSKRRGRATASLQKTDGVPLKILDKVAQQGKTHPFFTGKPKKPSPAPTADASPSISVAPNAKPKSDSSRSKLFTSNPCSPKKNRVAATNMPLTQFGVRSLGLKTPGAKIPAWPAKGMVHVRSNDEALYCPIQKTPGHILPSRKSKGNTAYVGPEEMVLHGLATKLQLSDMRDAVRKLDTEDFVPPPPELRLPRRHFESGVTLEKHVVREMKNPKHPALVALRCLLPASLSAFDKYQCESANWAQKYTPKSAVEVLQYGKEAFLLRDWLQALEVQAVDTGEAKTYSTKPPKKKRKTKLNDFIVDSDEEADEMDEVSGAEEDWSPDRRGVKKTVVRVGDILAKDSKKPARLTNTVIISGPPGCGKTSAVYAVARELEFEVFEINPGNRRSGKDILERIGDMTRNHLVQHQQTDTSASTIDDEEVAEDIKSGKQATMNAFFQPKITPNPAKMKTSASKTAATTVKTCPKKHPSKTQKQSLILLDEVDILYEEDKQFWATVMGLIAQSKRPFVMTCNDESLVPLQALNLHGIFRFSSPPVDVAIDRLLMVAACEGHILQRDAIEALYDARQRDLRACLMDLNYWCQFAVGDRRGAIDWFYPRWPKGADIDEDGNVVRVISQDTYVEGMGWLARDILTEETAVGQSEEELLFEAQRFWHVDVGNWNASLALDAWAATLDSSSSQLSVLEQYDDFTNAMSIADLCSVMGCASPMDEPVDCTVPAIPNKVKDDYIVGQPLLDAPVTSTFDSLVTALPVSLKCLARKHLQQHFAGCSSSAILDGLGEAGIVSRIRQAAVESNVESPLTRLDFSNAFDVLAASEKASTASSYLDPSVFDGTFRTIVLDVAPFVRGIVMYENQLQKQRLKLSSLLSQGGTKRMRKTRAAHAALEGGSRSTTRAERWFKSELNGVLVMHTAGEGWDDALKEADSVVGSTSASRKVRRGQGLADSGDEDMCSSSSDLDIA